MDELGFSLLLIFLFSLVTMGLLKAQKKIMPKSYFYYERLIDGLSEDVSYLGVLFRTSVPLFTGLLAGITALNFQHVQNIELIGAAVGFLSAFCLVWPDYYNPELISPTYANQKSKLYILYIFILIVFSLAGWMGGALAPILTNIDTSAATRHLDPKSILNGIVAAAVFALVTYILQRVLTMFKEDNEQV